MNFNPSSPPGDINTGFLSLVDGGGGQNPNPGTGATVDEILAALFSSEPWLTLEDKIDALVPQQPGPIPPESALFNPRFVDEDGEGVPMASVEIYQGSSRIGYGASNNEGYVEFSDRSGFVLLKGTAYSMRVYAVGYMVQAPISFTLSVDTAPVYELQKLPAFPVATNPQKAVVRVRTTDFSAIPLHNEEVTLTLKDARTLTIGDNIMSERFVKGRTNSEGEVDLEVWSDVTLLANGRKPLYNLKAPGILGDFFIRVPPEGGIAAHLKSSNES